MTEPEARPNLGSQAPASTAQGVRIVGGDYNDDGPGPEVVAADTLTGSPVVNAKGRELGKVAEIMIDVRRGRVAYVVLATGGFLGIGDKLFAIPWSALTLDADRMCFVLDVEKARLDGDGNLSVVKYER